ncbi:hypothetical protein YC2023_121731 [Brassica napus]
MDGLIPMEVVCDGDLHGLGCAFVLVIIVDIYALFGLKGRVYFVLLGYYRTGGRILPFVVFVFKEHIV